MAYMVERLAHRPGDYGGVDCWWRVTNHKYTRLETALRKMFENASALSWNGKHGAEARGLAFSDYHSRVVDTETGGTVALQPHRIG